MRTRVKGAYEKLTRHDGRKRSKKRMPSSPMQTTPSKGSRLVGLIELVFERPDHGRGQDPDGLSLFQDQIVVMAAFEVGADLDDGGIQVIHHPGLTWLEELPSDMQQMTRDLIIVPQQVFEDGLCPFRCLHRASRERRRHGGQEGHAGEVTTGRRSCSQETDRPGRVGRDTRRPPSSGSKGALSCDDDTRDQSKSALMLERVWLSVPTGLHPGIWIQTWSGVSMCMSSIHTVSPALL